MFIACTCSSMFVYPCSAITIEINRKGKDIKCPQRRNIHILVFPEFYFSHIAKAPGRFAPTAPRNLYIWIHQGLIFGGGRGGVANNLAHHLLDAPLLHLGFATSLLRTKLFVLRKFLKPETVRIYAKS